VQEYIPGTGAGVFTLCGSAGPVAWFAHRRIREKPPQGGVSVVSESAPVDPVLQALATKLLDSVNWFGPAMIEFRIDPEGRPWLMEVNGRFWGSLQLAIDSGVDFPWLFYRLCHGEDVQGPASYEVGRRLRWLLGDFDHLLLQVRGKGTARTMGEKLKAMGTFLGPQGSGVRLEVLRRDDRAPFAYELKRWFSALR
jgi:predicted ATP-grasp superfamily ATP-dependent carboligase